MNGEGIVRRKLKIIAKSYVRPRLGICVLSVCALAETIVWTWMLMMLHGVVGGHAWKKHAVAAASCKPKLLTALTRSQVEASLTSFEATNGKHLGVWPPGFPQLHLDPNTPLVGAEVDCSLLFMSQGVDAILTDQRDNLNPNDVSLHRLLNHTLSRIQLLAACVKSILGGKCASPPPPPQMPKPAFERKQWSHTLLKAARGYLVLLERKINVHVLQVEKSMQQRMKHTLTVNKPHKYLEGSGYLL